MFVIKSAKPLNNPSKVFLVIAIFTQHSSHVRLQKAQIGSFSGDTHIKANSVRIEGHKMESS